MAQQNFLSFARPKSVTVRFESCYVEVSESAQEAMMRELESDANARSTKPTTSSTALTAENSKYRCARGVLFGRMRFRFGGTY